MPIDEHWGLGGLATARGKNHCPDWFLGISTLCLPCQEFASPLKTPGIPLLETSLIPKTCILLSQYRDSSPESPYIL